MNAEVKKKWVDRLRSGKVEKAIGCLKQSEDKYCVLGVLCQIYLEEHPNSRFRWLETVDGFKLTDGPHVFAYLPPEIARWAGFPSGAYSINPVIYDRLGHKNVAASLNDSSGYSFNELADLIEKQF